MNTYGGVDIQIQSSLSSAINWVNGKLNAPAVLLPRKEPPVSILQEAAWGQESVFRFWGRDKSLLPQPGIEEQFL
jgi:hypothetical protein